MLDFTSVYKCSYFFAIFPWIKIIPVYQRQRWWLFNGGCLRSEFLYVSKEKNLGISLENMCYRKKVSDSVLFRFFFSKHLFVSKINEHSSGQWTTGHWKLFSEKVHLKSKTSPRNPILRHCNELTGQNTANMQNGQTMRKHIKVSDLGLQKCVTVAPSCPIDRVVGT